MKSSFLTVPALRDDINSRIPSKLTGLLLSARVHIPATRAPSRPPAWVIKKDKPVNVHIIVHCGLKDGSYRLRRSLVAKVKAGRADSPVNQDVPLSVVEVLL